MPANSFLWDIAKRSSRFTIITGKSLGVIPALCFLLATPVNPQTTPDAREEDLSVILLRVTDSRRFAERRRSTAGAR